MKKVSVRFQFVTQREFTSNESSGLNKLINAYLEETLEQVICGSMESDYKDVFFVDGHDKDEELK